MMKPVFYEIIMLKIYVEFYKLLSYVLSYFVLIKHPLLPRNRDLLSHPTIKNSFFDPSSLEAKVQSPLTNAQNHSGEDHCCLTTPLFPAVHLIPLF